MAHFTAEVSNLWGGSRRPGIKLHAIPSGDLGPAEADVLRSIDDLEELVWRAFCGDHHFPRRARVDAGRFAGRIRKICLQVQRLESATALRQAAPALSELDRVVDRASRHQAGGVARIPHDKVLGLCESLRMAVTKVEPTPNPQAQATGPRLGPGTPTFGPHAAERQRA